MSSKITFIMRSIIKDEMIFARKHEFGEVVCDICKNKSTILQVDEFMVPRNRTINNQELRLLSYSKEMCALLCTDCHIMHNLGSRKVYVLYLLQINIKLYGYDQVKAVFDQFPKNMRRLYEFPEPICP